MQGMQTMTGWLILAGYVLAGLVTAYRLIRAEIERIAREELERRRDRMSHGAAAKNKPLVDMPDRVIAVFLGLAAGAIWPLEAVIAGVARLVKAPSEQEWERDRELEALRKQARDLGLPVPPEIDS